MGKPRMIILVRHGQSEGNKNRDIHQTIPDHRVKLTPDGWAQAHEAGRRLRSLLLPTDTLHFFTSPYRRTRETTEGILSTLTSDSPSPTPFPRSSIKVYEEPRLREQDFGNFQPCSNEMERMWQERADYGHFFYRIPNGESAADAYDRVSGFNESLWRQFGEEDCASVCVLVTHGLMSRVFLMKWYHFSVEYFEDLRNVNHCEFLIMRKQPDSGKYILENKLRTWSELKRERLAQKEKEKEKGIVPSTPSATSEKDREKEKRLLEGTNGAGVATSNSAQSPIPIRKKWGGCPNGCDHGKHYYKKENSMHAMQMNGRVDATATSSLQVRRPASRRWQSSSEEDEDDVRGGGSGNSSTNAGGIKVDVQRSLDEIVSSPDGTPSFISVEDRLRAGSALQSPNSNSTASMEDSHDHHHNHHHHLLKTAGRDFGGSTSGYTSRNGSDFDADSSGAEEERKKKEAAAAARRKVVTGNNNTRPKAARSALSNGTGSDRREREKNGMSRGAKADALGDQGGDDDHEDGHDGEKDRNGIDDEEEEELKSEVEEEVEEERKVEEDVRGSVY